MTLRRRSVAVVLRLTIVISVLAGVVLTALGPATVTGLLPYFSIQSNLAVGLVAGYAVWRARRGRPDPPDGLTGAVTLYTGSAPPGPAGSAPPGAVAPTAEGAEGTRSAEVV
ncbi:hypothetical protein [Micromonospora sp. NPDC000442]|uniref:hypothetical protein n=1 Tax=Micromonospora sp. NPDC000442 TaxID=3364217 RepID=UPI003689C859